MSRVLVTGAGGFIGGHLVAQLRRQGVDYIRAVDKTPPDDWHQRFSDVDNHCADLQELGAAGTPARGWTPCTTWQRTWVAWASSRTTRRCACCRC